MGPTMRQGPHQAAQKSTITGLSLFNTVSSKFASVISRAIKYFFSVDANLIKNYVNNFKKRLLFLKL
jgi:hypothetical protein